MVSRALGGDVEMGIIRCMFSDRVDRNYTYSEWETKILRKAEMNVLIAKSRTMHSSSKQH
jgi:hypothetical protein